jgi:antigen flippase
MNTESEFDSISYRSILKSTSLIGGASIVNILIGMVRTKFVALLIGPTGVGLLGTFSQVTAVVSTMSGMGLGSSGVRQIAEAVGTGDEERIARTVFTLRRTVWLTGSLGMLVMIFFCVLISRITFDSDSYALPIALLGGTVLLGAIASGQHCILQGTRRIGDIARISVIGTVYGTLISIPCFYFWGQQGIVVSLILCAVASLTTSWWFARRVPVSPIVLKWNVARDEARQLFALGLSFVGAGLVTQLSYYLIRVYLVRQFGLNDVGVYQSAFGLSGILVGFVLSAMGTDYYPRLTTASGDNARVRQMVNEQAEISVLLSLPALAAMMVFAPLLIRIFYTESFMAAVPILRWSIFGVLGRVFSWPLGFVILAKGKGQLYFLTELFANVFFVGVTYYFALIWGLIGTGMAFMILYVFYTVLMLFIVHRLVGASWTRHTLKLTLVSSAIMIILMLNCSVNVNPIAEWGINFVLLVPVTYLCLRRLSLKSEVGLHALIARFKAK